MLKRCILTAFAAAFVASALGAQGSVTAADFFAQMQEKYSGAADYEASIAITANKASMKGVLAYRAPKFLRIDFSEPANQVIAFNGEELTVYLPEYSAILVQAVGSSGAGSASMASPMGLALMKKNYTIAYDSSPQAVPLEADSAEMVIKLSLAARVSGEGYKKITLSVNPDSKLIRRMEGLTVAGTRFQFDFRDIKLNQGIPEARFIYDSPASANLFNNFLFKTE